MALEDPVLPKRYKNSKVPFEQDFDSWRLATQNALATVNLNLTQIAKDCVGSSYEYNNDGDNTLNQSLQDQINLLSTGGIPITGTTSATWTINSSGFYLQLDSQGLTGSRNFTFPDVSDEVVAKTATQTLTNKTLTSPIINGATFSGTITSNSGFAIASTATTQTVLGITADSLTTGTGFSLVSNSSDTSTRSLVSIKNDNTLATGATVLTLTQDAAATPILDLVGSAGTSIVSFLSSGTITLTGTPTFSGACAFSGGNVTFDTDTLFVDASNNRVGIGTVSPTHNADVSFSSSGASVVLASRNTSNTASSNAILYAEVAGSSAGDPYTLYTVSGVTSWAVGLDNSDSDFFKISRSSSLGTNDAVVLNASGEMLLPNIDPPTANYMNRNSGVKIYARNAAGSAIISAYNISSYSHTSTGQQTYTIDTDFTGSAPTIVACSIGNGDAVASVGTASNTSILITTYNNAGTLTDMSHSLIGIGDQ